MKMKGKLKLLGLVFVFLVALVGLSAVAQAADFEIDRVSVDDVTIYEGGDAVYVERGQSSTIKVWISGVGNHSSYDTRVRAWVGGYEYDEVKAVSEIFEVEPGVDYRKVLLLDMPDDMKASKDYTLHVEVYDDDNDVEKDYVLRVQETRHLLEVRDVIFRPGTSVEAGRPFFTTVRVENMGDNKEENIKVTVSIPELGVSARDYIDELAANEDSDSNEDNEDEEDSMSSDEIYLRVPETAETGDYQVKITVEYDRGHKTVTKTETLHVQGTEDDNVPADVKSIISVDSTAQELKPGEEASYKVMIANLAETKQLYAVEVLGTQLWADSRVEPGFITLQPDETGELYVTLKAHKDTKDGHKTFTLRVVAGEAVVKEINVGAEVVDGSNFENWKLGLEIAFLVLVIVLVVLGLIIVFRKSGNNDDEDEVPPGDDEEAVGLEEPTAAEGQTYY